ncbi:hypothetical protein ACOJQI_10685 [Bacillus salacetis]|uniref:hypothetical protein n=1 Tax=Bacillus salacetis TaxID=2315464 RepID=UPI003B9E7EEA
MMKWRRTILVIAIVLMGLAIVTNPSKEDYMRFSEKSIGEPFPEEAQNISIERNEFFLFSTYTPVLYKEHGITHLGIYGQFIQISKGQFDYPFWLEFFN